MSSNIYFPAPSSPIEGLTNPNDICFRSFGDKIKSFPTPSSCWTTQYLGSICSRIESCLTWRECFTLRNMWGCKWWNFIPRPRNFDAGLISDLLPSLSLDSWSMFSITLMYSRADTTLSHWQRGSSFSFLKKGLILKLGSFHNFWRIMLLLHNSFNPLLHPLKRLSQPLILQYRWQ